MGNNIIKYAKSKEINVLIRSFKLSLLVVLSSLLFSCSTMDEMQALDASVRAYERAIRWGDFAKAKSFHKNNPQLSDLERRRLKFYRITSYSVIRNETSNDKNSLSMVEIKYYKNDRPVIKTLSVKQHWKRDKGSDIWYIETDFPNFR